MIIGSAFLCWVVQNQGLSLLSLYLQSLEEVVRIEELSTAIGAFEMLAGDVLGCAAKIGAAFGIQCSQLKQLRVTSSLW